MANTCFWPIVNCVSLQGYFFCVSFIFVGVLFKVFDHTVTFTFDHTVTLFLWGLGWICWKKIRVGCLRNLNYLALRINISELINETGFLISGICLWVNFSLEPVLWDQCCRWYWHEEPLLFKQVKSSLQLLTIKTAPVYYFHQEKKKASL